MHVGMYNSMNEVIKAWRPSLGLHISTFFEPSWRILLWLPAHNFLKVFIFCNFIFRRDVNIWITLPCVLSIRTKALWDLLIFSILLTGDNGNTLTSSVSIESKVGVYTPYILAASIEIVLLLENRGDQLKLSIRTSGSSSFVLIFTLYYMSKLNHDRSILPRRHTRLV